uniref:Phospholipase A2 n=1 Tax=Crangon crangon TaxID=491138 RepID=A0A2Z4BW43_CRACN|nr:putative phospholipase A2 [Crangon crangon]AWU67132.1 putative phospholipase A2 [Crangon crangon]
MMAAETGERALFTWRNNVRAQSQFDPFQVFEVEHEACLHFEVFLKQGEAITKGSSLKDFIDTPDPYVVLRIPGSSNSSQRTDDRDNCHNPVWNESYHFYLDPANEHTLQVKLMDANYTLDEELGVDTFCVNSLTNDVPLEHTFNFPGGSKVHATLKLERNKNPDLRFSLALCNEEKEFLLLRRKMVLVAMQKLLGDKAPDNEKQVPIIGILGSGGGFRAMTCLSGAVKALQETGILDCATYIAGLSGSSWYISTLYAHDNFPNVTHSEVQSDLRDSVTQDWKWHLRKGPSYIANMIAKYMKGQPVSFTDFFGHLLGDVLLKGAKHKKLTDMKTILSQGIKPLPLFTCLHAKRNVSCKSFSEWVEFSPYEIGIAKYGTFMKSDDFGCKFIVGKKIKNFPELPLHFLQGVWGSAFTILFKRLVMERGRKDIVQIMRDAQQEDESDLQDRINNEQASAEESDSEDEKDIVGNDDLTEDEENMEFYPSLSSISPDVEKKGEDFFDASNTIPEDSEVPVRKFSEASCGKSLDIGVLTKNGDDHQGRLAKSMGSLSLDSNQKNDSSNSKKSVGTMQKAFSFELPKRKLSREPNRKFSTESDPGVKTEFQTGQNSRLTRKDAIKGSPRARKQNTTGDDQGRSGNNSNSSTRKWADRRNIRMQEKVDKKAGIWEGLKQNLMTGTNILNSRAGRAGEILNPFRGLSLRHAFPLSPFTEETPENGDEETTDELDIGRASRYEPLDNSAKKLFIVDSGLAFNSPYPLLLRPQRAVDIYLSFDFSQRPRDGDHPFKELLLAEKWAVQNKVPFPPISKQAAEFEKEDSIRECYVFKHPSDQSCPVILHFSLVNNLFREFSSPGVPRTTDEEKAFADFPIFDDVSNPYSSMNFVYEPLQFDRLTKLVEFNTLLCIDTIKKELEDIITRKKQHTYKPWTLIDVVNTVKRVNSFNKTGSKGNLKLKVSVENELQLKNFARQEQNLERQASIDSAEGEFLDALEQQPDEYEASNS